MLYKEKQYNALLNDYAKVKDTLSNPSSGYDYFAMLLLLYYKLGYGLLSLDNDNVYIFSSGKQICYSKSKYLNNLKSLNQELIYGKIVVETNILSNDIAFAEYFKNLGVAETFINASNAFVYADDFKKVYGAYLFLNNFETSKLTKCFTEIFKAYSSYNKEGKTAMLEALFDPVYSLLLLPHIDKEVAKNTISYLNLCIECFGEDFYQYLCENKQGVCDQIKYYISTLVDESHQSPYQSFLKSYNEIKYIPKPKPEASKEDKKSKKTSSSSIPSDFAPFVTPSKSKPAPTPVSSSGAHAVRTSRTRRSYKTCTSFKLILLMLAIVVVSAGLAFGYYCLLRLGSGRGFHYFMAEPFRYMDYQNWAAMYFDKIAIPFTNFWHLLHYTIGGIVGILIYIVQTFVYLLVLLLSCLAWVIEKLFGILQYGIAVLLPYISIVAVILILVSIKEDHFSDIKEGSLLAHISIVGIICSGIFLTESAFVWIK